MDTATHVRVPQSWSPSLGWRPGRVYFLTILEPSRDDRTPALTARSASHMPPYGAADSKINSLSAHAANRLHSVERRTGRGGTLITSQAFPRVENAGRVQRRLDFVVHGQRLRPKLVGQPAALHHADA